MKRNQTTILSEENGKAIAPSAPLAPKNATRESEASLRIKLLRLQEPLPPEQKFVELVRRGVEAWVEAGTFLYEQMKKQGHSLVDKILSEAPWMNESLLWNFYNIGARKLHPHLLLSARNLTVFRELSALPFEVQAEICDRGVPFLEVDGKKQFCLKPIHELSNSNVKQIVYHGRLATKEEQEQYLRNPAPQPTRLRSIPTHTEKTSESPPEPLNQRVDSTYRVLMRFGKVSFNRIPNKADHSLAQRIVLQEDMGHDFAAIIEIAVWTKIT